MSVSSYFGLTESGKSYHVQNHVLPQWNKVIIFDPAFCFQGGKVVYSPNDAEILKLFREFVSKSEFKLIVRPDGRGTRLTTFNKICELAFILGEAMGKGIADKEKRIQLVTDEADSICSPHYKSEPLHHLVNEARHDNVDSHFIARLPTRVHTDIRGNSSKIVTFRLQNAGEIPTFTDNFGREIARKIKDLPKYWRLEWTDNGGIAVFDEKNKINQKFLGISREKRGIEK